MVQETIKTLIESRSYSDLLLIFPGYFIGTTIYFLYGQLFAKHKIPWRRHLESGLFMSVFMLLVKGFLPLEIFTIVSLLTYAFVFYRVSGMDWLRSCAAITFVILTTCIGDSLIMHLLKQYPKIFQFIACTSAGISLGAVMEGLFPAAFYFLIREVIKRWKMRKSSKNLRR